MKSAFGLFFVFLSTANALAIDTPSHSWAIGETVTEYWETTSPDDPAYFSLELRSSDSIFSLVDNIPTSSGSVTFTVPDVYPGLYNLAAVHIMNEQAFAQSANFEVL